MNMRRHIMLVEQYRLMSLLLESRESVIFDKFTPLIAKMRIGSLDINAIRDSDVVSDRLKSLLSDGASVDKVMLAHGIITMVWAADPNPKKAYTTWLLTRYVAGNIKLEDLFDVVKEFREENGGMVTASQEKQSHSLEIMSMFMFKTVILKALDTCGNVGKI